MAQLKAKGITLRCLTAARSPARRPRPAVLKAVAPIRPAVSLMRRASELGVPVIAKPFAMATLKAVVGETVRRTPF